MARVRQSTTVTGTAASAAARSAAAYVPEISALRCTDTTDVAPWPATSA